MSRVRRSIPAAFLALALIAPAQSAFAGDEPLHSTRSLLASAVAHAARFASAAQAPAQREATQPDEPRSFFKSPRGIVVLAALAATAGYVFYSKSHDRVHSPGME